MGGKERIKKFRTEFETLNENEKNYLMGIAKALAFAHASEKAVGAPLPPEPDDRGAEQGRDGGDSIKGGTR
jgi:hypothetical protein